MPQTQFSRNDILGREDLSITLVDNAGNPVDAHEISFAIYDFTTDVEVLVGPSERNPAHPEVGEYYAPIRIPRDANLGTYRIRWTFKKSAGDPENTVLEEFEVVTQQTVQQANYSAIQLDMISRIRNRLRDNNPDRNYHFRPPTGQGVLNEQNEVFSYIWEDYELIEYMQGAVDYVNMWPPQTGYKDMGQIINQQPSWRQMILMGGIVHACFALSMNWIADEFSIGGEVPVTVILEDGEEIDVPISELYEICHE